MACTGCTDSWTPTIKQPYYPPKGGWGVVGIPPGTPAETAALMSGNERWEGGTGQHGYEKPIQLIIQWLQREQNVTVTQALESQIREWANAQWCAKDPGRCTKKTLNGSTAIRPMAWAESFWKTWNSALVDTIHPVTLNQSMILVATGLIRGPDGCERCARNWDRHLVEFPYERADTLEKARVWLWHVHNLTRENKTPTPYEKIAKKYAWKSLTEAQLQVIISELKSEEE